jgi:hypothetical protein
MTTTTPDTFIPRVRWSWLWTQKRDLVWNLLPFWLGFVLLGILYATRGTGPTPDNPMWDFSIAGREIHVMTMMLLLYGPLIDAPHLWATIARTYTDREEWASRRRLFLGSLLAFAIGPIVIIAPYGLYAIGVIPASAEPLGWLLWSTVFGFYTIFHINKQHWGFVCLYKRKNSDSADPTENRVDAWFFQVAIWLPYVAMLTAPWFVDNDGKPFSVTRIAVGHDTVGSLVNTSCHALFLTVCAAYVGYQISQWRKGVARNGPKLLYIATVIGLYYVTFALHPRLAAFWVLITGTGHCLQYHAVVWAYGRKKYTGDEPKKRSLPSLIFGNVWLYVGLGVLFGLVTMQGPGARIFKDTVASVLQGSIFAYTFSFLDPASSFDLGIKVAAAVVSGVRLHHFYVDSKIWKVSKSAALAKNLNVST